ncbi:phage tail protein [Halorientalis pallida]|uniref:Phage tail protein n=1 Tax=Halorientalis pallida TaxID=2479928 RepID=A0A498L4P9_9EURY|nr:phage tail protein [Halorientalis pallida]RXK51604.1 phage tail protein [Halorientalis pallida]
MPGDDPYPGHRFEVDIGTETRLGFTAVRGLSVRVEVAPDETESAPGDTDDSPWWDFGDWFDQYRESLPATERRRTQSPNLHLRRGVGDDTTLWDWVQEWVAGTAKPRTVHVLLCDGAGRPVRGWRCLSATPVEWTGPELVADRSGVATEELELAHEGLEAVSDLSAWVEEGEDQE